MGQLQEIAPKLTELGYQILAVSPDGPEKLRESAAKNEAGYTFLSDREMQAALAFGIAFRVDDKTADMLHSALGAELPELSGSKVLPVPAAFVVSKKGTIAFSYANPDYKTRVDPSVLLAAAEAAK